MFAIVMELLTGRYTATQFNDRSQPEWPPHPARLYSAMVAAWADSDEPERAERDALRWLERQPPPSICCSEARRRDVVTHYVPVNDPTALARSVSSAFTRVDDARRSLRDALQSGDSRAVHRAQAAVAKAETKAIADGVKAGLPTGRESATMALGAREVLPEYRTRQPRTYPTVIPEEARVWFVWPGSEPGEGHLDVLEGLLARLGRVGHSSTLVACRTASSAPPPTWIPGANGGGQRLRVPQAGLLDQLESAFTRHQGSEPRLLPAGMAGYKRPSKDKPKLAAPLLGGDWYLLGIRGRHLPSAVQTLRVSRAVRHALLAHSEQPPPEVISGHQRRNTPGEGPTPPLDRPHLAVVPLPSVGHRHSDGTVFAIALVLPADCPDSDRAAVERAIRQWAAAGFALMLPSGPGRDPLRFTLEDLGFDRTAPAPAWLETAIPARRKTATRSYWCHPARRWITATPIALDRFPGKLRSPDPAFRDRAEAETIAAVTRACILAGLPEPAAVTIRLDSPLAGVPGTPSGSRQAGLPLGRFPTYQTGNGTPRVCVHAEIEFTEPVRGPVLLGAGRYFGYGLCLPRAGSL